MIVEEVIFECKNENLYLPIKLIKLFINNSFLRIKFHHTNKHTDDENVDLREKISHFEMKIMRRLNFVRS